MLKISFGTDKENAHKPFSKESFAKVKEKFLNGWRAYIKKLHIENQGTLYKQSVIAIKSAEDKDKNGATVASLAIPWGSKMPLSEQNGYHLIWVRDLFFTAVAMYFAGDAEFAHSALNYMLEKLRRDNGSFKQNAMINGEERWNATQMDQVAFPIILARFLKRNDLVYILRKSADFILNNGPQTEQERWEEIGGFSPYAISLQARALAIYAEMSKKAGLEFERYGRKAEEFLKLVPKTCYTKEGVFHPYEYFVRISKGSPDNDKMLLKGTRFTPREMVSTDFLYLVFSGFYSPNSPYIKNSIEAVDRILRINTRKGPSFYRYNGDIYGFDEDEPKGRLWTILTAERGIFELMRNGNPEEYLNALENFATSSCLLPEQVFENGEPTESATPLTWSHAAYIILHSLINKNLFNKNRKALPFL